VLALGLLTVNGHEVNARDGVVLAEEDIIRIKAIEDSEVLLADLP
jgi:hypothetical protein